MLVFMAAWAAWTFFASRRGGPTPIEYTDFIRELEAANITEVTIVERDMTGKLTAPATVTNAKGEAVSFEEFKTYTPDDPQLVARLLDAGVIVRARAPSNWPTILIGILPWLLIIGVWVLFMRRMSSGQDRAFTFGKSRARPMASDRPKVTFADVAGIDEAKEELQEVIDFLKAPQKFQRLGGRIPKGVLLVGPTGTGKTLLARAVAGEAGVPFSTISGSDFVEMFVGVGAARVRDLFEQGKRNAPCIIFIDEIDAVGRQRGAGLGGGHDEREQTLNQLLVEMDGFSTSDGVIIMAATNRPDILDRALLRPGRFDRQVVVDRPDVHGREGILRVHVRKVTVSPDADLSVLARGTPGFSGADLANMVNEAALLAARRGRTAVTMQDFEDAKDKVLMGVERRSLLISETEKRWIAHHEAGHTLVSKMIAGTDPIHKVSIIPRGRALGITQQLPLDDKRIYSRRYCLNQLAVMLGGRAAELLVFEDLSTGAHDDIEKATLLARKMVCEWGMSPKVGPLTFGRQDEQVFLGREIGMRETFSERTAQMIDDEIRRFVEEQGELAKRIVTDHRAKLEALAEALLEKENLSGVEVDRILGIDEDDDEAVARRPATPASVPGEDS
ncbi:MAG TPA: ATP-dependent metallopeptidase FtsH/Yme1/Tma family protein [candidate division WOR-3 bacterium]|uniref:ATP-dependent zinc metalloprotease FtsH n=1 Tax=candidate division WOR-3 bacterium TaxID=2052148 RepID=A0A7V0T7F2_UNCW3|nr:ATP-dependent metallopeptidase FtsH/Yme1/Tma family protein [candidate division WOR-3 bacterium]